MVLVSTGFPPQKILWRSDSSNEDAIESSDDDDVEFKATTTVASMTKDCASKCVCGTNSPMLVARQSGGRYSDHAAELSRVYL